MEGFYCSPFPACCPPFTTFFLHLSLVKPATQQAYTQHCNAHYSKSERNGWIAGEWAKMWYYQVCLKLHNRTGMNREKCKIGYKVFWLQSDEFSYVSHSFVLFDADYIRSLRHCLHEAASLLSNYNFAHNMPCVIWLYFQQAQAMPFTPSVRSFVRSFSSFLHHLFCVENDAEKTSASSQCTSNIVAW